MKPTFLRIDAAMTSETLLLDLAQYNTYHLYQSETAATLHCHCTQHLKEHN